MAEAIIPRRTINKQEYVLLADVTVETATTSVDITGLNIGKEEEIVLVSDFVNSTSNTYIYLFANGNNTTTNYYSQELSANGSSVLGGRYNFPYITINQTNQKTISIVNIKLTNNGYVVFQANSNMHYTGNVILINANLTSTFTTTSITSLRIASSVSNAIGIGSRFQLYRSAK